jgi:hypothetical protein
MTGGVNTKFMAVTQGSGNALGHVLLAGLTDALTGNDDPNKASIRMEHRKACEIAGGAVAARFEVYDDAHPVTSGKRGVSANLGNAF